MTRYVLMPPDTCQPEMIFRSLSQYAKAKGFRPHVVYHAMSKHNKHQSDFGILYPVEMPDANHNRRGRDLSV